MTPDVDLLAVRRLEHEVEEELSRARRDAERRRLEAADAAAREIASARLRGEAEAERRQRDRLEATDRQAAAIVARGTATADEIRRRGEATREEAVARMVALVLPPSGGPGERSGPCSSR